MKDGGTEGVERGSDSKVETAATETMGTTLAGSRFGITAPGA
jgi:hypothetical protein